MQARHAALCRMSTEHPVLDTITRSWYPLLIGQQESDMINEDTIEQLIEDGVDATVISDIVRSRSVVKSTYKVLYAQRAVDKGKKGKAAQRCCGDWLANTLNKLVLDKKERLVVERFEALLDANGVVHSNWNRTSKGWQGRLRMTGRKALEAIVADVGILYGPEGEEHPAPRAWCIRTQR